MSAAVLWIRVGVANSRQILRVNLNFLRFAGDLGRVPALFNCDVYARHTTHNSNIFERDCNFENLENWIILKEKEKELEIWEIIFQILKYLSYMLCISNPMFNYENYVISEL